jgi:hypothetical protein
VATTIISLITMKYLQEAKNARVNAEVSVYGKISIIQNVWGQSNAESDSRMTKLLWKANTKSKHAFTSVLE